MPTERGTFQATLLQVELDRYHLADIAIKVVGIGSVGTICWVCLFMAADDDPLFLQVKEARPSVLEPYAGKSVYANNGQRVVEGQRLMQSASDIVLGWLRTARGGDGYIRQLRDAKISAVIEDRTPNRFAPTAGNAPGRWPRRMRAPAMPRVLPATWGRVRRSMQR